MNSLNFNQRLDYLPNVPELVRNQKVLNHILDTGFKLFELYNKLYALYFYT